MRFLFNKFKKENTLLCWILISLFIIIIRFLGLLQPLEFAVYDFLFYLRSEERQDNRIILVTWDESNIQKFQEGTISDRNLVKVLKTIINQQPSVIGLDLYRDVPVPSFNLSRQENQLAYQKLSQLFSQTDILVGIAKIVPPSITPPKSLQKNNRVTAADLILDRDGTIRRAYLYPTPKNELENPLNYPALGLSVAVKYLLDKNFELGQIEENNAMLVRDFQNRLKLKIVPLQKLDGSYIKKEPGFSMLVNWRKYKNNSPFDTVSMENILNNSISSNMFKDKIVLIGNISTSSSDRHQISLNRWQNYQTSGVEIHAHVASSIISAVLDSRPIIKTVSEWLETIFIFLTGGIIIFTVKEFREKSPFQLFAIASGIALILVSCLWAIMWVGFIFFGYWIAIVPALLCSLVTPGIICLIIYIDKIKQNYDNFQKLIKDINHSLQNYLNSILAHLDMARSLSGELVQLDPEESIEILYEYEEREGEFPLNTIQRNLTKSYYFALELNEQQQKLQDYLRLTAFKKNIFIKTSVSLNNFLKKTIARIRKKKNQQYNCSIHIEENYDEQITNILIEDKSFTRVLETLIDNAYYAIEKKTQTIPEHQGIIQIKTQKQVNKITIEIADNGIGMNQTTLKQIFEPFFTTKPRNKGQGLGLFLVRETIARHQGNIVTFSRLYEGSRFTISLPSM